MKTTFLLLSLILVNTVLAQTADLSITKSTNLTRAIVGQNLTYTLQASNDGPDANTQVLVSDFLPEEVSIVSMDPACVVDISDTRLVNCNISLAANVTQNLDIEVKVDSLPPAGPRVYLSGTFVDGVSTGFFRSWVDSGQFDVLGASEGYMSNPRGVYLQEDGGGLIVDSGNDLSATAPVLADGSIYYSHPLQSLGLTIASGDLLVNPNDVIKAPDGMLYVADLNGIHLDGMGQPTSDVSGRIIKVDPSTGTQTIVAEGNNLSSPTGLIWFGGQLIVSDLTGKIISVDPTTGTQQLLSQAGLLQTPQGLTEVDGVFYVVDSTAGVIAIEVLSLVQSQFAHLDINGGVLSSPVDIDHFNNQELYVLNGNILNGSHKIISRFNIATGMTLSDVDISFDMNEVNGFDVDDGGSFLINHASIASTGSVVDNNFLNDSYAISTPVDAAPPTLQILVTENITVADLVAVDPALQILITENITVADLVAVNPALQILVTENITLADLIAVNPALQILVSENITVADLIAVNPALQILIAENISVQDTISILIIEPPRIVKVRPISGLCHNQIISGNELPAAVTELEISFSVDMANPTGDTSLIDVSNPMNYRLVSTSDSNQELPTNCADPIGPNSIDHMVGMRFYDSNSKTAVLSSPLTQGLPDERYVLLGCFDGLKAQTGGLLDGNGDGTAGDDYAINFSVSAANLLDNPNFGNGINAWTFMGNVNAVSDDADNALYAGSANIDLGASIGQCVSLNGASNLRFGVSLQSDLASGNSTLKVEYYDAAQCSGTLIDSKQSQKPAFNGVWNDTYLDTKAPNNAVSAMIIVEGNVSQSPILVDRSYFISPNIIFGSGFESVENDQCFRGVVPSG